MKILKKITSLTMSAILLFTTNSALQAAKVDTVQMQEIKELRADIAKDLDKDREEKVSQSMLECQELMARYARAVNNYKTKSEKIVAELKAQYPITKEQEEEAKTFVEYLQKSAKSTKLSVWSAINDYKYKGVDEKTKEIIKQVEREVEEAIKKDSRYKKIKDKNERKRVAIYTNIFMKDDKITEIGKIFAGVTAVLLFLCGLQIFNLFVGCETSLLTILFEKLFNLSIDFQELEIMGGVVGIIMLIIFVVFTNSYVPEIAFGFDDEKVFQMFTEKPFDYLADFNNIAEYINVYKRNHKSAQVLNDAVDIEYYLSLDPNPSLKDVKEKLYTQTIDWYDLTADQRAEYLHNFAERLRTEAKAKGQEYSNTHSFRKGLAEK